jgi:hypothetical protein
VQTMIEYQILANASEIREKWNQMACDWIAEALVSEEDTLITDILTVQVTQ